MDGDARTINFDLTMLSPAERVWLWRYRLRARDGHSKGRHGARPSPDELGARIGVRGATLRVVESGMALPNEIAMVMLAAGDALPEVPTVAEACALARRRWGQSVMLLCEEFRDPVATDAAGRVTHRGSATGETRALTKQRFGHWEGSARPRLVEFWRAKGFRFPES